MPGRSRCSIRPFDEDFGYVTLEAFLARKPVITCTDAGGPTEFVVDGVNGFVCDAGGRAGRRGDQRSSRSSARARAAMGDAGRERAARITWDGVIEKLVGSDAASVP